MNANCDLHEETLSHSKSTESLYVLDIGGYSSTFLVPKKAMTSVLNAIDGLIKVRVRTLDLQRDYACKSRYETVIVEDEKSVISIQSYNKGGVYRLYNDEVDTIEEDFRNLRAKNDQDKENE